MKRAFIRAIWGDFMGIDNDTFSHTGVMTSPKPSKLNLDIMKQSNCGLLKHYVYVFGRWNKEFIRQWYFEPRQISRKSNVWDMKTELYRHKLEVLRVAMEDFDEIVYLDWDCVPQKQITDEIWDILGKKESFQANLQLYKTKKCLWRKGDQRKTCNGGFIYIRDKKIPDLLIKNWESFKMWTEDQKVKRQERDLELRQREKSLIYDDEPSMSMYVDDVMGGWKGMDDYWSNYEPDVCNLKTKSAFSSEKLNSKNVFFVHEL